MLESSRISPFHSSNEKNIIHSRVHSPLTPASLFSHFAFCLIHFFKNCPDSPSREPIYMDHARNSCAIKITKVLCQKRKISIQVIFFCRPQHIHELYVSIALIEMRISYWLNGLSVRHLIIICAALVFDGKTPET